jgi:hypothetical protein
MKRLESRITLMNNHLFSGGSEVKILPHLISINKVIDHIDSDEQIQRVCEFSELKKNRINQLNGLSRIEFHQKINDVISDAHGTNFLIFKN